MQNGCYGDFEPILEFRTYKVSVVKQKSVAMVIFLKLSVSGNVILNVATHMSL